MRGVHRCQLLLLLLLPVLAMWVVLVVLCEGLQRRPRR
jgi:hypothetical protein